MNQISFRDPDGFIIETENKLYRIVLSGWVEETVIMNNDFYRNFSIPVHKKVSLPDEDSLSSILKIDGLKLANVLAIYEVEKLNLITYPWEWTPVMLISAGIFTLELQKILMKSGYSLKDASFFNVQFESDKLIFIDLLSIKQTDNFYPWIPYGQLLRHFIYPSTLLKYDRIQNLKLLWNFADGIDHAFACNLIPSYSVLNMFELFHYTIARHVMKDMQQTNAVKLTKKDDSQIKLLNLIDWNISYLEKIRAKLKRKSSYWAEYYKRDVSGEYYSKKSESLRHLLESIPIKGRVLDLGSNIGEYSLIFMEYFDELICLEKDTVCCEVMYANLSAAHPFGNGKKWNIINADIARPDPAIGWMNKERKPLLSRIKSELVSALALIHHIYFTESIDFYRQAELFDTLSAKYLLVEFIYSDDDKVEKISKNNPTRLSDYSRENFVNAYNSKFSLKESVIVSSSRELFLFEKKNENEG